MWLTQNQVWEWYALSDREKIRWAIMTEDAVKMIPFSEQARLSSLITEEHMDPTKLSGDVTPPHRTSMNSNNLLLDVYDQENDDTWNSGGDKELSTLDLDRMAFKRKRHLIFDEPSSADDTLPIDSVIGSGNSSEEGDKANIQKPCPKDMVPPTKLHYDIIAEAYKGYVWKDTRGKDGRETAAIMGGAVVAALTAWKDDTVRERFGSSLLLSYIVKLDDEDEFVNEIYAYHRSMLVGALNDEFIHSLANKMGDLELHVAELTNHPGIGTYMSNHAWSAFPYREVPSQYSLGDVDIFIQPDMVETTIVRYLKRESENKLMALVREYVGSCWSVNHLIGYFKRLTNNELKSTYSYAKATPKIINEGYAGYIADNIVTGTRRGITNEFASCAENIPGGQFDSPKPKKLWPRITQAIQLDAESALQIGLFDFDISAAAAADTGANVLITFRCAYALLMGKSVVTPAILREN